MNRKIFKTLEYAKIIHQVSRFLTTEMGKEALADVKPSSNASLIRQRLDETDDGFHLYRIKDGIPVPHLANVTLYLKRLDLNASLSGIELAHINKVLLTTGHLIKFFQQLRSNGVQFRCLYRLIESFTNIPAVSKLLARSIDEDGNVLSSASSELYGMRQRLTQIDSKIRAQMNRYTTGKRTKYLNNTEVTVRDDRYVIPIKASAKHIFGGIVHDQSASGETLYVEPKRMISLNNYYRRTQLAVKQAERKVLRNLSRTLRPYQKDIINDTKVLGHLDLINAKAHYAYVAHDTKPLVSAKNIVNLKQARHPLINPKQVVANDIELGKKYRAIIITGPNTGGKTITIKTLGLIQLMGQSGLFIPAKEGSQIGVFDNIFADIGDDQSIEQNLSTFSSHMNNIIEILHRITAKSLVLLDEVGAGTDPNEGAALAISILDAIGQINSEVVVTTHYPKLKTYGYNHAGTINASMEFDPQTLQPTYHLLLGVPGQSNGLNIAKRLGLDSDIIAEARSLTSSNSQNINSMITELAKQTRYARHDARRLRSEMYQAASLHRKLYNVFQGYQKHQSDLDVQAKEKANLIINETRKRANRIIADLHHKQKQVAHAPVKENELMNDKGKLNSLRQNITLKRNPVLKSAHQKYDFHRGDDVYVKPYGQRGVLIEPFNKHQWKVQIGILKMKIDTSELKKITPAKQSQQSVYTMVDRSSAALSPKLDLRGMRYTAAMRKLDRYLDSALLAGYSEITIIHGKGTGVLRRGVNAYLRRNRRVKSFHYSPPNAGGDGSTIAKLK